MKNDLDLSRLCEAFADDRAGIADLLDTAAAEAQRLMGNLARAGDDEAALAALAHAIKGLCGNVGAHHLADLAADYERALEIHDRESASPAPSRMFEVLERLGAAAREAAARFRD